MRSLLFAAVVLVASGSLAQTPDPLDPRGYFPLAVGNEWEYRIDISGPFGASRTEYAHYRVANSTAGPTSDRFALINERYADPVTLRSRDTVAVRYDAARTSVLGFYPDSQGGEPHEAPFPFFACDLGLPFDGSGGTCWDGATQIEVAIPLLTGESTPVDAKRFANLVYGFAAVHGIGFVGGGGGCEPCWPFSERDEWVLTYARIDGRTYGSRSVSSAPRPALVPAALHGYPNPTAGPLHLRADGYTAAPLQVEIYDALGRLVLGSVLPPEGGRVDLEGLPRGPYAVRAGGRSVWVVVQ